VTVLFLIVGLIMTGQAIRTSLLMVIVMVTGDLLSMFIDDRQRGVRHG
jgi:H+-transporting ATPase